MGNQLAEDTTKYFHSFHFKFATKAIWSDGNTILGIATCSLTSSLDGKGRTYGKIQCDDYELILKLTDNFSS